MLSTMFVSLVSSHPAAAGTATFTIAARCQSAGVKLL